MSGGLLFARLRQPLRHPPRLLDDDLQPPARVDWLRRVLSRRTGVALRWLLRRGSIILNVVNDAIDSSNGECYPNSDLLYYARNSIKHKFC